MRSDRLPDNHEGVPLLNEKHAAKRSRVDWQPLSDMLDFTDRSPLHSGRPSVEQVPMLPVMRLRKMGAGRSGGLDRKSVV